jgi:hypothetical protein
VQSAVLDATHGILAAFLLTFGTHQRNVTVPRDAHALCRAEYGDGTSTLLPQRRSIFIYQYVDPRLDQDSLTLTGRLQVIPRPDCTDWTVSRTCSTSASCPSRSRRRRPPRVPTFKAARSFIYYFCASCSTNFAIGIIGLLTSDATWSSILFYFILFS